jgi:hypothetical protein
MGRDLAVAAMLRGYLADQPGTEDVDRRLAELIELGGRGEDVSGLLAEIFARPAYGDGVQAVRGTTSCAHPKWSWSRVVCRRQSAGALAGQ